jgi:hypothetical protein
MVSSAAAGLGFNPLGERELCGEGRSLEIIASNNNRGQRQSQLANFLPVDAVSSTLEFVDAEEAGWIRRICNLPEINQQPRHHQTIRKLRHRVQDAKGFSGLFFLLRRRSLGVHGGMQVSESRLQPMSANQAHRDDSHEQTQHQTLDRASAIKPLRDEMSDRDCPANLLKCKISPNYYLSGGAGIPTWQETEHFVGKKCGAGDERKKNHRSQPYCRV